MNCTIIFKTSQTLQTYLHNYTQNLQQTFTTTKLYTTLRNLTHVYIYFSQLHKTVQHCKQFFKTLHKFTKLDKTLQTKLQKPLSKCSQNFTKLHKTLQNLTQLHKTLHNSTKLYQHIEHFTPKKNCPQVLHNFNHTQYSKALLHSKQLLHNFTNLCKP